MGTAADNALNNALMRLMEQDPLPPMPQEAMPRSMVLAPPGGVMDLPTIPDDPRIKAIQDAQAQAKQDFANIRNGAAGPAPAMSAVTGNRTLLANDERSSQLGQLKDTLAGMNPRPSAPEPIMPSRAAQTGAYGSSAYQSDRNARLAILNDQERNRQPIPALPEHTVNLDNLPDALKQVYAQRAANEEKRNALVASGALKPLVAPEIASPEKVRADKQRRAEEEAYRQGNWSMQEQARAMSRKLGINPLLATAMVSDRMQQGAPVTGNGEPRMPDSWEPRLRQGATDGLTGDIMQSALLGPQGAALVRRQEVENQGGLDRINAQRGTMTPQQMAGLTTAQAMINSGDPMAVQQGIQMARGLLSGQGGLQPQQNIPAPGADPGAAHAVANNYQHPKADQIVDAEFAGSNMADGLDFWNPWNQDAVNEFASRAANRLAKELGVNPTLAMNYIKQWYQRKKNNSATGLGFPDIGPSMAPVVGGRRDVLTMPAQ